MIATYHEHMRVRSGVRMSGPEAVEFGMRAYFMVAQMVFDHGFSAQARRSFPRLGFNFTLLNLRAWIERMHVWFGNLSDREQELFRTLEFAEPCRQPAELTQEAA